MPALRSEMPTDLALFAPCISLAGVAIGVEQQRAEPSRWRFLMAVSRFIAVCTSTTFSRIDDGRFSSADIGARFDIAFRKRHWYAETRAALNRRRWAS